MKRECKFAKKAWHSHKIYGKKNQFFQNNSLISHNESAYLRKTIFLKALSMAYHQQKRANNGIFTT